MPQKSAVMDSLARWVKIQKQSLYIRMKTYKDRKASGLTSPHKSTPPPSLANRNVTPNMPTLTAAQSANKPQKSDVKSPKTDKPPTLPHTPVRPSAPTPTASTAAENKSDKVRFLFTPIVSQSY